MRKSALLGIVVAVVVIVGGIVVLATNKKSGEGDMNMTSSSSSTKAIATDTVTIKNFAFSPASITVKKGTTVTWTNKDSTSHTVTGDGVDDSAESGASNLPGSGTLAPGQKYEFTFNVAGTFKYHCSIHSQMTGTVTVTD